jgi:hypothetical protein
VSHRASVAVERANEKGAIDTVTSLAPERWRSVRALARDHELLALAASLQRPASHGAEGETEVNINGIGSGSMVTGTTASSTASVQRRDSSIPPPPGAASSSISQQGSMFSQLQQLSQQDPTRFKEVMTEMAKALRTDASQQTGPAADRLTQMASRMDQAASSGDVSQLAPQQPQATPQGAAAYQGASGKHHHHHGGGSAGNDLQQAFEAAMSATSATTTGVTSTG